MADGEWLISYQLSAISYQLSVISHKQHIPPERDVLISQYSGDHLLI